MLMPFQRYGNWLVQMVAPVVSLRTVLTVSISVLTESQPAVLVSVSLYMPAALYVLPFHVYGSWLVQMVVLVVSRNTVFTVRMRLMIESQPLLLLSVSLYVPAAFMLMPFQ